MAVDELSVRQRFVGDRQTELRVRPRFNDGPTNSKKFIHSSVRRHIDSHRHKNTPHFCLIDRQTKKAEPVRTDDQVLVLAGWTKEIILDTENRIHTIAAKRVTIRCWMFYSTILHHVSLFSLLSLVLEEASSSSSSSISSRVLSSDVS